MAMDFFQHEDDARRQTVRLLVMFALSVCVIILAIYLVAVIGIGGLDDHRMGPRPGMPGATGLWNPVLFFWVAFGTTVVVSLGSLYKLSELSGGGETVALMMGGRAIDPQTTDVAQRRLLNVVEEMALASGVPVPPVFVLENEPGINAFAAGYQPGDAVVAVSQGAILYLTRDELQGVLGHEFSHILNGDMRLNLRLIGIVYGILVLAIVGYYIMQSAGSGSRSSSSDSKRGDGAGGVFMVGLAIYILGYLGVLLGNLIKSAISREREFLADASSVQFTRNPAGLAGALKKIGGLDNGSRIRDGHAEEIRHMFFADAFAGSFFNLFASHPPLGERIRRLEPEFDGRYPEVRRLVETGEPTATGPASQRQAAAAVPVAALASAASPPVVERIGRPQTQHIEQAGRLAVALPEALIAAAREPLAAQAVIYALLLSRDDAETQARQWGLLQVRIQPPLIAQTRKLAEQAQVLCPEARLPLVDLAVPALKRISPRQYADFRQMVEVLVAADGKVDLFEYCLRVVLLGYLDVHFRLKRPPAVRYRTPQAVAAPMGLVLSALAYAGQSRPEDIERAFQAGAAALGTPAELTPRGRCTFAAMDAALAELAQAAPQVKRAIISAAVATVSADGVITLEESELLRAIAAALACPVPLGYTA